MANAGVIAGTASAAPGAWRRFAAYMVQAFSAARAPCPRRRPDAIYRALLYLYQPGQAAAAATDDPIARPARLRRARPLEGSRRPPG